MLFNAALKKMIVIHPLPLKCYLSSRLGVSRPAKEQASSYLLPHGLLLGLPRPHQL